MTDTKSVEATSAAAKSSGPEALLDIIRKEARYLEEQEGSVVPVIEPVKANALPLPVWDGELDPFPVKTVYHCYEFLVYDDIEFVINAYRGILQRDPDESGLDRYTSLLRSEGENAKREILIALSSCEEGIAKKVRVDGLGWDIWERKIPGWPWYAYPIKVVFSLLKSKLKTDQSFTLDNMLKQRVSQRKLNEFLADQQKQLAYIDGRSGAIEHSHQEIGQQVNSYRDELLLARQDILLQQQRLNSLLEALENQVAAESSTMAPDTRAKTVELATHASGKLDTFYLAFENECRGEESEIRQQLGFYLDIVKANSVINSERPLLDIGSGRGEWLGLLKDAGITASGVDISRVLADHCKKANLDVVLGDGIEHLKTVGDSSLGAVSAFHLIEHLPFDALFSLVEQAHRILVPGGQLIFETPNPENILVGSHTFYHDPTHRNPITPTLIDFLVRYLGFVDVKVERLHPYPEDAKVIGVDMLTQRFNGHFCGPQDFAVIATKPNS
jgi:SAM-dependent methyltransferase